uniref:G protein-coupled receptor n=1 Tax=Plectus sambesii TaxID=2011161 RepID=A0A914VIM7_9BILA
MLNDAFGEDPSGFCGTKKFTSVPLLLSYEFTVILIFFGSLLITGIYYYRLIKWLKDKEASIRRRSVAYNNESIDYTSGVMRVMKIVTLLPLFTMTPTAILTAGQMILPRQIVDRRARFDDLACGNVKPLQKEAEAHLQNAKRAFTYTTRLTMGGMEALLPSMHLTPAGICFRPLLNE